MNEAPMKEMKDELLLIVDITFPFLLQIIFHEYTPRMLLSRKSLIPVLLSAFLSSERWSPIQAFAMNNRWGPHHTSSSAVSSCQTALSATSTAASTEDSIKTSDILSLDSIRSTLIRQEETIIFAIIERAQFRQNDVVYEQGGFGDLGVPLGANPDYFKERSESLSFLEYMLIGTVSVFMKKRIYIRYCSFF